MGDFRRLFALAAPHRGILAFAVLLMVLESAAALAVPWLGGRLAGSLLNHLQPRRQREPQLT